MATFPIETPQQMRTLLKAMRQANQLTQTELGTRLGVSQKRIARIEAEPGVTSFDQLARLVAAMGYRFVLEELPSSPSVGPATGDASW
ncbi:HTH-type transcriptional regulator/antitoxin HipB [Variovorax sp. TBS-050B]|uniref:helix-turn-helix domain-containing protein n=1 Tax=Variovorax sp. TBS-050B TaxID=2940551 RepID=UPI002476DC67|nr:helix-turn-helix domain-containing protein [Variovorax sp. TBS-050B]MDH6594609.1 HTH-type transcriptional regulator/antitoxin HipB [Variovorax sp. TBS-050B]